jgi:DNA mismatch endonuclease Vsr
MDKFTPEKRSEIMSNISSKNTSAELLMRKELTSLGLRYRIHSSKLPGKPDIVFTGKKVAVFIDGDWWHGRNYEIEHTKYTPFWQEKIKGNMIRDAKVTNDLERMGWKVFRIWEKDLKKSPSTNAEMIRDYLSLIAKNQIK